MFGERRMSCLHTSWHTVRLGGIEPDDSLRLLMAQRLMTAAATGEDGRLTLVGAALGWLSVEAGS